MCFFMSYTYLTETLLLPEKNAAIYYYRLNTFPNKMSDIMITTNTSFIMPDSSSDDKQT